MGGLPSGAFVQIADELHVATPEFALLTATRTVSFERCLLLATELCGTYSPYKAPAAIAHALQGTVRSGRIPRLDGWEPCCSAGGGLSGLWSRPALTTPDSLAYMADQVAGARGSAILRKMAEHTTAGAASPFESKAGLMLGLPRSMGGMGLDGMRFNECVDLSRDARALAGRNRCYCDLYWDDGLDVECQSALIHNNERSYLSDSNRIAALSVMGVRVLPLTYDQLVDQRKFDAFAWTVAKLRGIELRPKTKRQLAAATRLREELFRGGE